MLSSKRWIFGHYHNSWKMDIRHHEPIYPTLPESWTHFRCLNELEYVDLDFDGNLT